MRSSPAFTSEALGRGGVRLGPGDDYVLDWLTGRDDIHFAIIVVPPDWDTGTVGAAVRATKAAGLRAFLEAGVWSDLEKAVAAGATGVALLDSGSYLLREPGRAPVRVIVTLDVPGIARAAVAAHLEAGRRRPQPLPSDVACPGRQQLVLLPGMLGDASLWDAVASELLDVASIRTARVDLADSIADLADLVLAESPARFALAGHSLGAVVALEVVRREPDRVTRLALLNAGGRMPSDVQHADWARLAELVGRGRFTDVAEELAVRTLPESRRVDQHLAGLSLRMALTVGADGLLRQLAAQQTRGDYLDWLSEITVPTVVVSGELDDVSPAELQRELAAGIHGAEHLVLAECGHMAPVEKPQALADALRSWLSD